MRLQAEFAEDRDIHIYWFTGYTIVRYVTQTLHDKKLQNH